MLDKKDLVILVELAKNSRVPATRIARILGISDVAVKKRLAKLEKEGVIRGYNIVIDPRKLGFKAIAQVGVNVDSDRILEVAQRLASREDVVFVAVTSGDHDIMAEVWAEDSSDMQRKLQEIREIPGVRNIFPAIILDVIKEKESFPLSKVLREGVSK